MSLHFEQNWVDLEKIGILCLPYGMNPRISSYQKNVFLAVYPKIPVRDLTEKGENELRLEGRLNQMIAIQFGEIKKFQVTFNIKSGLQKSWHKMNSRLVFTHKIHLSNESQHFITIQSKSVSF